MFRCWSLDSSGQTLAYHIEGFDLRPDWRDRRRCHNVSSRKPSMVGDWDYRYCWLRPMPPFTLLALMNLGYYDEAQAWRDWLVRAVAGSPRARSRSCTGSVVSDGCRS